MKASPATETKTMTNKDMNAKTASSDHPESDSGKAWITVPKNGISGQKSVYVCRMFSEATGFRRKRTVQGNHYYHDMASEKVWIRQIKDIRYRVTGRYLNSETFKELVGRTGTSTVDEYITTIRELS